MKTKPNDQKELKLKRMIFILMICFIVLGVGSYYYSEQVHYARLDPLEHLPGGDTTVWDVTDNAFGLSARNLDFDRRSRFFVGNSFFKQNWVMAPASTAARDGLGPQFNARSCSACHFKDGRGEPPEPGENMVALLLRISVEDESGIVRPHPVYSDQIENFAIPGVKPEAHATVAYTEVAGSYPDGTTYSLRHPTYHLTEPGFGEFPEDLLVSPRIASHMIGMGLLEAIPAAVILAQADPDDSNGDGISGRPNYVMDVEAGQKRLGRFGWKANQPTTRQQVAAAFVGDIGITSPVFPEENHTVLQQLDHLPSGAEPGEVELSEKLLDAVVFYSMTLAVPARRDMESKEILRGKKLFQEANCVACHTPRHTTGELAGFPELSHQVIFPYTDLLLHDMGEDLADGRPDGEASGREWRTPPLWGIGLIPTVNKHTTLLHDGRARNVEEAILWHGGEAATSRQRFKEMKRSEREALISFVNSL